MKKTLLFLCAAFCITTSFAQSGEEQAWMSFMTPGEEHKMLAKDNGEWSEDITIYMSPSAPPVTSKSTCTNTMVLGGRYQKSVHKGNMMGMPFEGESTVGFDNGRKVWFSTWVDNMGTGIMYGEGVYDKSKKALILNGKMTDPNTSKSVDYKEVMTWPDEAHQKMEMYVIADGKEIKTMEILFTRIK
jgi:hypothetical protein